MVRERLAPFHPHPPKLDALSLSLSRSLAGMLLAALAAAGAAASSARAQGSAPAGSDAAPAQTAPQSGWKPPDFDLDAELRLGYARNLFHVADRRRDDFRTERDRFERFHGMEGPSDREARLTLDLSWRFRHASRRGIDLRFRTRQYAYERNEQANGTQFGVDSSFDLTRKDAIRIEIDYSPTRFHRNYPYEIFPLVSVYERADLREVGLGLGYAREWGESWSTGVGFRRDRRDFDDPFDGRDERSRTWSLEVRRQLGKRVGLGLGFADERARTGTSVESGVPKDRSHDDRSVQLEADFRLPHGIRLEASAERRERDYRTDEPSDPARFRRTDRRWDVGLEGWKRLRAGWSVGADLEWIENRSNRPESDADPDDAGYRDFRAGIGLRFKR